ncbi:RVT_3 domain-containing protein [Cephalotus follicularis]|uniref:RVT_3 domain-containing protein n=1 Tax=Cephalotus follicularis TaxID=3775 RepID=A0A1Q3APR9_CEPFO|nr:RVT_3 domain-containing protein [Cephalotus follicularis]
MSNNATDYEALIIGLKLSKHVGADKIIVHSDYQLVVHQLKGSYETKESMMIKYLDNVKKMAKQFKVFEVIKILGEMNCQADVVAKLANLEYEASRGAVFLEKLNRPSIEENEIL